MARILFVLALLALTSPALAASMDNKPAAGFTDAAPSPAAASAPKDTPRNDKPMGDATTYFAKKDFTPNSTPAHAMTYFWRQPAKIDASKTYPLVVVLHDDKGQAPAATALLTKELMDAHPSFILVPTLPAKKIWAFPSEYPDDPTLAPMLKAPQALSDVMDLIADTQKNFPVDDKRIYIVGCGDGGFGALGAVYNTPPSTFAAAIAMNGGWTQKQTGKLAKSKTAFYLLAGTDDKVASPTVTSYVGFDIQKLGGTAAYLPVPGATHDCTNPNFYMKPLWSWMYAQHLK